MVDLWRPWIEERAGRTLSRLGKVADDQALVRPRAARHAQDARPLGGAVGGRARGRRRGRGAVRGRRAAGRRTSRKARTPQDQASDDQRGRARKASRPIRPRTPTPTSSMPIPTATRWPMRASRGGPIPTCSITRRPSATRCSAAVTTRRSRPRTCPRPTSWSACARSSTRSCATCRAPSARLANKLQRKLLAQQNRAWDFDLEEGMLDRARLTRIIIDPMHPLSFKHERDADFRDTVVTLLLDNSGSMRGRPDHGCGLLRRHPGAHAGALRGQGRDPGLHHEGLEGRAGARGLAGGRQAGQPWPPERSAPHHLQDGRRALAARQARRWR